MALVDLYEALVGRRSESTDWIVVLQGRGGRTAAPVSEVLGTRSVLEDELVPEGLVPAAVPRGERDDPRSLVPARRSGRDGRARRRNC